MMADRVLFLADAVGDLEKGRDFYERQKAGLGTYFLDSLIADIESLRLSAGVHSIHFGTHRVFARHFPFAIYYNLKDGTVTVVAILDMRSNPTWAHEQVRARG